MNKECIGTNETKTCGLSEYDEPLDDPLYDAMVASNAARRAAPDSYFAEIHEKMLQNTAATYSCSETGDLIEFDESLDDPLYDAKVAWRAARLAMTDSYLEDAQEKMERVVAAMDRNELSTPHCNLIEFDESLDDPLYNAEVEWRAVRLAMTDSYLEEAQENMERIVTAMDGLKD
jgi:hypothetical protein